MALARGCFLWVKDDSVCHRSTERHRERSRLIQNRNIGNHNSLWYWDNLEYVTRKLSGHVSPISSWYLLFCGLGFCRLNREQGQKKKADPIMGWLWKIGGRSPTMGETESLWLDTNIRMWLWHVWIFVGSKMKVGMEREKKSDLLHMPGHSSAFCVWEGLSRSHRGYGKRKEQDPKWKCSQYQFQNSGVTGKKKKVPPGHLVCCLGVYGNKWLTQVAVRYHFKRRWCWIESHTLESQ